MIWEVFITEEGNQGRSPTWCPGVEGKVEWGAKKAMAAAAMDYATTTGIMAVSTALCTLCSYARFESREMNESEE